MKTYKKTKGVLSLPILVLITLLILIGCDRAKETVEEAADNVVEKTGEVVSETAESLNETVEETLDKVIEDISFLVGTWSGKFDIRTATLEISKQDGNNFEGKITINLRTVINQEIKGSFDTETKNVIIKDQLRSKFKGIYVGTLSEDRTTLSGVFTTNLDNKKFNFNLKKN
jgi:PBP1b-binding outer membrane lipoprotein LpoB